MRSVINLWITCSVLYNAALDFEMWCHLKIKVDAIEETFLVTQRTFQWVVLNENNVKNILII